MVHTLRVQTRARLVEDQDLRISDELARYEDAARLPGREGHDVASGEVGDAQTAERVERPAPDRGVDARPHGKPERAVHAAHHNLDHRQVHADLIVHRGAHDAQRGADVLEQGPRLAPKPHGGLVAIQREHLAREQLDERRLSRAVRAQQGHMLPLGQREVLHIQNGLAGSDDLGVMDAEQGLPRARSAPLRPIDLFQHGILPGPPPRTIASSAILPPNVYGTTPREKS